MRNLYLNAETELNGMFFNRNDEIRALILGHLTKTNVAFLGDPGTGKTYLAEQFASIFPSKKHNAFFNLLLTPFTKPAEVFGPINYKKLKEDSVIDIMSENYIPNSKIAFLDELSRGEAVINSLLQVINERKVVVNGITVKTPLEMVITATNFKFSSSEFNAMRDRFLQWMTPKSLDKRDRQLMKAFWRMQKSEVLTRIDEDAVATARAEVAAIIVSEEAEDAMLDIMLQLEPIGIIVSDRRSKWVMNTIVKAQAWLNGHAEVQTEDLEIVWSCLWEDDKQIPEVRKAVRMFVNPERQAIEEIFENSQILMQSWGINPVQNPASAISEQLKTMRTKLNKIKNPKPANKQSLDMTSLVLEKFQEKIASVLVQKAGNLGI